MVSVARSMPSTPDSTFRGFSGTTLPLSFARLIHVLFINCRSRSCRFGEGCSILNSSVGRDVPSECFLRATVFGPGSLVLV